MSGGYREGGRISELVIREPIDPARASWIERVRSADHKTIGTTLIGFSLIALVLAGFVELLAWAHLAAPENTFLTPERFYSLHTLSDTTYLYLVALPLFSGLATYVLPLQIGARGTAFPRLSALGAWMIVFGGAFLYFSLFFNTWHGGADISSPLASTFYSPAPGIDFWLVAVTMIAGGLTANAIDLAVTYMNLRAPGMDGDKAPVFAHASAVYAYGILATAPVLAGACLLMLVERQWEGFGIFDPVNGGNAMLWKTLFQWWAHAAPYLITLLAAGAVCEILQSATGVKLADRGAVKKALVAYAALAILGFGQSFYGSPVAATWNYVFMVIGFALLIPAAVLLTSWVQTLREGKLNRNAPALFALAFVLIFALNTIVSMALAMPVLGQWLRGSEFGYIAWMNTIWGVVAFGGFGALLYWFPKITGRKFDNSKAVLALAMLFVGTIVADLSVASLGLDGFAREISSYPEGVGQARFIEAGLGTLLAACGVIGLLINLIVSSSRGARAGNDPWHAGTLEWFAPSPPPVNNFDAVPLVESETPLYDTRRAIAASTGELVGTVAQSPTSGRPALRESKH